VEHAKQKGKLAALKAELNSIEGGSAIKLEIAILKTIHKVRDYRFILSDFQKQEKPYFPAVYHAAKRKRFCYIVMTLLGENLRTLKVSINVEIFT
jgi:hypothetical protein